MMSSPYRRRPRLEKNLLLRTSLLLMAALCVLPAVVESATATCDRSGCGYLTPACGGSPVTPVPRSFWGELQPVDVGPLPHNRDASFFNEFRDIYSQNNWYRGLSIENNYLVTAMAYGLIVWDLHQTPAAPVQLGKLSYSALPVRSNTAELPWPIEDVAMVDGDDTVAALVGEGNIGVAFIDLSDKSNPRVLYQNDGKKVEQVYAATLGPNNREYAFIASPLGAPSGGVFAYDLTQAKALPSKPCEERVPTAGEPVNCPGVYLGKIGTRNASYIHGAGNFIVESGGVGSGIEIWNVANPQAPQLALTAFYDDPQVCLHDHRAVFGVAMWSSGGRYYLAMRTAALSCAQGRTINEARIYDVTCITSGSCSGLGSPIWSKELLNEDPTNMYVTYSRGGGSDYLYFGSDDRCGSGVNQREWLFDTTVPVATRDITPANGYWGWYYRSTPTGFNQVEPRRGKFNGSYFYRTALSIMDIHQRTGGVAPAADFSSSPAQIYPGDTVTFTDQSSGVPTSWSWSFAPDGTTVGGTSAASQNPQVKFGTKGSKTVSLTATNSVGPSTPAIKPVIVLDPAPQIGGVTVSPASPLQCQPVTLTATGVTGQATLGYSWNVANASSVTAPGGTSTANPFIWDTHLNNPLPGAYTATVTVANGSGTASKSAAFTLGALPALPAGHFSPTNTAFSAGTVQFNVAVAGATEWNWDFGDGNGFTGWTSDPILGPSPSHVYTSIGNKAVTVKVRNCLSDPNGLQSDALTVHILQITPLVALFNASCSFAPCSFNVGSAINFTDQSQGAQLWDYDWTHTAADAASCNFTDAGHSAPVTSHTYAAAGNFQPCLRVRRGASESNVFVHTPFGVATGDGGGSTPSLQISGPSSGTTGTAVSFSASATNCSPAAGGWSWSLAGGTAPSTASSTVSVTWSTTGPKTLTVTNTACSGAIGSLSVNITSTTGGGGTLGAAFNFSPTAPSVGQAVSFDGSASTGNPTLYSWSFGDNSNATGQTVSHSYANAGNYNVVLTVCSGGSCAGSVTHAVVVGKGGPTPLDPSFSSNALCLSGPGSCVATTGAVITLSAVTTQATSYAWDFGDGLTGSGPTVTHAWSSAGNFTVKLTVANSQTSASHTAVFQVSGPSTTSAQSVLLPWIAQTRGVLVQSSDLYVHNPTGAPMDVTLEFRRRGTPETNPPRVTRRVDPGATLFSSDVLNDLFARPENTVGFVTVSVPSGTAPVITSYNTTFQSNGAQFGQTISGVSMTAATAPAANQTGAQSTQVQHLIALNDNPNEVSYFGLSNPNDQPASYRLSLFDNRGKAVGAPADLVVARLGLKQFQREEIESLFGIANAEDYRVQIESLSGGQIFPYGAKLRTASLDPSFIGPGETRSKLYVIGALSTPGLNSTLWRSDVVLSNTSDKVIQTTMSFIRVGVASQPLAPVTLTLQPGETQRLANVVADKWGVTDAVGILTFNTDAASSAFPIVQGESYDFSTSVRRFGQSMPALPESAAASPGQGHYMVGLRQDASHWTAYWLFNPSAAYGTYDLVYRGLDGKVLGQITGLGLPPGKSKLFRPSEHPIPAAGVPGGFTVQIVVHAGEALAAGQVVNLTTNDPAYILGTTR